MVAGVLIGFGAKTAGGCTSGNGLSGTAVLSPASLVATATFFATAIVVTFIIEALTMGAVAWPACHRHRLRRGLSWTGMTSPDVIREALLFHNAYLYLFFASAVATATLGLLVLRRARARALLTASLAGRASAQRPTSSAA